MVDEDLCFWSAPKKIGLNLIEDFFFWFIPNFGQKIGLNLSEDLCFLFFFLFGLHVFWAKNQTKFE